MKSSFETPRYAGSSGRGRGGNVFDEFFDLARHRLHISGRAEIRENDEASFIFQIAPQIRGEAFPFAEMIDNVRRADFPAEAVVRRCAVIQRAGDISLRISLYGE